MTDSFCDTCCMFCDSPGQHYVNSSKYHKICDFCPYEISVSKCKHCSSTVKIKNQIERPTQKTTEQSTFYPSQLTESKQSNYLNSLKITCSHCYKESQNLNPWFCSHSLCSFCYLIFNQIKTHPFHLADCEKRCELCYSDFSIISCSCNKLLCRSCYSNNSCLGSGHNLRICNSCDTLQSNGLTHQSIFICYNCLEKNAGAIKNCENCSLGFAKHLIKSVCKICEECEIRLNKRRSNQPICSICKERSPQNLQLKCSHKSCVYCYHPSSYCLQCRLVSFKYTPTEPELCYLCNITKTCNQLFCDHYACQECVLKLNITTLNYCCTSCFGLIKKHCVQCMKISKISRSKTLEKQCCSKSYCLNCYKKKGIFHRCKI